jgi:pepF/M3 family oligoendopeptidase
MTVVYPDLDSDEFRRDFARILAGIGELESTFDRLNVWQREDDEATDEVVQAFEVVIRAYSDFHEFLDTLNAYIRAFVTTDSRDADAQARNSELRQELVRLSQLDARLTAWIGSLDVEVLIDRSELGRELAFFLRRTKEESAHLMSMAEENLAAQLEVSGGSAWSRLWSDVTSQLSATVRVDGVREKDLPIAQVRNMAYDEDRSVRRGAYDAELAAWKTVTVPLAASMNGVKGETNTLAVRRKWESALDLALFNNNIDRDTLDAMMNAARETFPDFRRYLGAKARALGIERLAWFDLYAPLGKTEHSWGFEEAHHFLVEQFAGYSEKLSGFVDRAFRERWIDAEPRNGKRGGAFCMWLRRDESRVLTNYMPTYDGVSTLAHELGHAYHNLVKAPRMPIQRQTPMTLAETASIFCETIIQNAALARADRLEQIAILEQSIQGACQVVVDITSRFRFESRVFEKRRKRELAVEELNELMLEAQRETYGDGLDQNLLHPYMWAVKTHYYSTERPYYNYPYMFGLLFGLGLYSRYVKDPEGFKRGYDDLLSSTGMADAATLAARFGIDVRATDFWRSSLNVVRCDIDRLESMIPETVEA